MNLNFFLTFPYPYTYLYHEFIDIEIIGKVIEQNNSKEIVQRSLTTRIPLITLKALSEARIKKLWIVK